MSQKKCLWVRSKLADANLLPLTYTQSVLNLRIGPWRIEEWFNKVFLDQPCPANDLYLLAENVFPEKSLVAALLEMKTGHMLVQNDRFIAARVDKNSVFSQEDLISEKIISVLKRTCQTIAYSAPLHWIEHLWNLTPLNKIAIKEALAYWSKEDCSGESLALCVGPKEDLKIASGVRMVGPITLVTEQGPVIIDQEAQLITPLIIEGPAYIGPGSIVSGARIRPGTVIGPVCKISGEVSSSTFASYANKAHDGYVGDSYIGNWVNLGAMTTTSNLKNNYHPIKVHEQGELVDTGSLHVGSFIGDHVMIGIGSLLGAGSTIGPYSNIFGGGLVPKNIPAGVWGGLGRFSEYHMEDCAETCQTMRGRRNQSWGSSDQQTLENVYQLSKTERIKFLKQAEKTSE